MSARKIKVNFLLSTFILLALITFGIYPFVMSIILLVNNEKFENKGLAIATGILGLFTIVIGFIVGFFLKPRTSAPQPSYQNPNDLY
ncbi:MAG: hypothetical protein K2K73_03485 [Ureaplasma sp.]|nr:hypothetical protein [Ureaplasma sp.]